MSKFQKSVFLVTTALNLSLMAPAAVRAADTVVAASANEIEQVVVTARRKEERLQDVPISITVFNQQQLQNHNVVNADDLAKYTPSLQANTEFGSQNSSFAIRGFTQDIGTAPSVGVFFDDVVSPRGLTQGTQGGDGAGPGDFFDLQNVQVLKGPQGTLFGRNTTGGDILLVPQKPTDEFGGYVQGSFGNYNMRGGQGVINIPVNDQIRLRFGIDHQSRDGYLNNTSGIGPKDFDDVNYTALRASLDIDLTPDLEDYIVASYSNSDTNGDFQKLVACNPNKNNAPSLSNPPSPFIPGGCQQLGNFTFHGLIGLSTGTPQGSGFYDAAQILPNTYSKLESWRIINTTTWHASDNLAVKNIASYAQLDDKILAPLFGTNLKAFTSFLPSIPPSPFQFAELADIPGRSFADQATYTEELQLQGNSFDNRLSWQAGGYMEGSVPVAPVGAQTGVVGGCPNVAAFQCYDPLGLIFTELQGKPFHVADINYSLGTTNTNDYALYSQATYKLTDEFKLTGGFRYSWDRESNTTRAISYIPGYPLDPHTLQPLPPMVVNANCTNPYAPGIVTTPGGGFGPNPVVPAGDCIVSTKASSNAPTWLLDLDYTPTDNILVYAKWARGYRQGAIFPLVPAPYSVAGPEKVDDYELGIKTSFDYDGISGTFDVDGFYNDFRNQQVLLGMNQSQQCQEGLVLCVTPGSASLNAGKSRIDGVELDTTVIPYEGVTLQLGYTYLDTDILSARAPTAEPEIAGEPLYLIIPVVRKGDELELSPRNKATMTASYTLPLDESVGKITLSTTFTHTDSMLANYLDQYTGPNFSYSSNFAYLDRIKATDLLDLNLNWQQVMGKPLDLSVFATNVTGYHYYTYTTGLMPSTGVETASVGEPTFYGVRVTIHFGED